MSQGWRDRVGGRGREGGRRRFHGHGVAKCAVLARMARPLALFSRPQPRRTSAPERSTLTRASPAPNLKTEPDTSLGGASAPDHSADLRGVARDDPAFRSSLPTAGKANCR